VNQLDLFEQKTWSLDDDSVLLWLTFDISPDDGTTDSAFAEIFENKYGYPPDEIARESLRVVTRVFVGPIKKENQDGPCA